ncbi:MAG TPA: hypothetical protein VMU08_13235, partial [Rhizomicrobium sp.]|nr:hypothetical protein [Rhizomicrobium sp.]
MVRSGVSFVRGYLWFTTVPDYVARDGLMQRFAVVQDSYRPDKPIEGMYFDEALWRRLAAFAAHYAPDATITIEQTENGPEIPVAPFFAP